MNTEPISCQALTASPWSAAAAAGHADHLLGGDVGGDDRDADDRPGQRAAAEEVVRLVLDAPLRRLFQRLTLITIRKNTTNVAMSVGVMARKLVVADPDICCQRGILSWIADT